MAELARVIYSVREGVNDTADARLRDLDAYLDAVSRFQSSLDQLDAQPEASAYRTLPTGMNAIDSKRFWR